MYEYTYRYINTCHRYTSYVRKKQKRICKTI